MGSASRRLWRHNAAATSIEYALIAAFIALVIFASVGAIATPINATFTNLASHF